jgi:L-threonylcarbamoyladenylate synthase
MGRCADADAVIQMGADLYEVAKNLYKSLRDLDRLGVDVGLVPAIEEMGLGLAVMNRLRKAAGHREARNIQDLLRALPNKQ